MYPLSGHKRKRVYNGGRPTTSTTTVRYTGPATRRRLIPLNPRRSRLRSLGYHRTGGYYGRYPPLGDEQKFFEDTQDVTVITTAGIISYISLNRIPQGVTESTRVGRKCVLTKIMLRGYIQATPVLGTSVPCAYTRIIVYLDKQANGATAIVTDILETADEKSFNNLSNSGRFHILKDKNLTLNTHYGAGTDTLNYMVPFRFFHKCRYPLEFSSTTGAITELRSNNVGVLAITGVASGTVAPQVLVLTSRVRFSDQG